MAEIKKGFTCIWKIKNFNFRYLGKNFVSPCFFVPTLNGTECQLHLFSNFGIYEDQIICYISRSSNDTGPDRLELNYELSFLSSDGTVLQSIICKRAMEKGFKFEFPYGVSQRYFLFASHSLFRISHDTLTIRCRIWNSEESNLRMARCFAETRLGSDCRIAIGTIEKFSCIESGTKYPVKIKSSSIDISAFSMNLLVAADSLLKIQIKYKVSSYICKIFILDKHTNKVVSGQDDNKFSDNQLLSIPLSFSKDHLLKNKEYFLPNNQLNIRCEIFLPGPVVNEIEYIFGCEDTQTNTDVLSEKYHTENITTLKDDWISMFREGTLCDAKLNTATETFPVHTVVLSARSPVFKSMFTNDMKEKTNHCVDIDDLDADTVRRMLLFMYSDTLDDLEYESAKSLYFAADKYNIVSLRQRSSNFLMQNLLQSNCLDILLLADKHQDKDLKDAVQNYIAKNDEEVLCSDEWRNLEETNSRLTTEVFRFIYMKNRRK